MRHEKGIADRRGPDKLEGLSQRLRRPKPEERRRFWRLVGDARTKYLQMFSKCSERNTGPRKTYNNHILERHQAKSRQSTRLALVRSKPFP